MSPTYRGASCVRDKTHGGRRGYYPTVSPDFSVIFREFACYTDSQARSCAPPRPRPWDTRACLEALPIRHIFALGATAMEFLLPSDTVLRDRYRIEALVGQGGMGAVYKAHDLLLPGRLCAIKEVLPAPGDYTSPEIHQSILDQFHREATILARLDHPNLPKVSDVFSWANQEYLVMDFVVGPSLSEVLRQTQLEESAAGLPEAQVLEWSRQLLDALAYLHGQSPAILHGDIKPANIILTPSGLLKLVDFGLVQLVQLEDQKTITVVQGRGTMAYTPIERFGGDVGSTDPATDIYSLGATLYHLLAGQIPPDAKTRFLEAGQLPSLRQPGRAISARTESAVFHAMAMHPSRRPPSVAALRQELLESPAPSVAHGTDPDWSAAVRAHWPLLAVALLLVLAALLASLSSGSAG